MYALKYNIWFDTLLSVDLPLGMTSSKDRIDYHRERRSGYVSQAVPT